MRLMKLATFGTLALMIPLSTVPASAQGPYFGYGHQVIVNQAAQARAAHNATIRQVQRNITRQRKRF